MARESYAKNRIPCEYRNVKENSAYLDEMLKLNGNQRKVPTIVDNGKVIIGFEGT